MDLIRVLRLSVLSSAALGCPLFAQTASGADLSMKTAKVTVVTGKAVGSPAIRQYSTPSMSVTVPTKSVAHLKFSSEDQQAFGAELRSVLVRKGIFASVEDASATTKPDVSIDLVFLETAHKVDRHEYRLHVRLRLGEGAKVQEQEYQVSSSEGDSFIEKITTDAAEGKAKARQQLMEKLVPDILAFAGGVTK